MGAADHVEQLSFIRKIGDSGRVAVNLTIVRLRLTATQSRSVQLELAGQEHPGTQGFPRQAGHERRADRLR